MLTFGFKLFIIITFQVSVLEIYNENIHDLLAASDASQTETRMKDVRYDANENSYVPGLIVVDVHNTSQVLFLLGRASQPR